MVEKGEVIEVRNGTVKVRFVRKSACAGCHACGMPDDEKEMVLSFDDPGNVSEGDRINVDMPQNGMLVSVLIMYVVPLLMLFVGLFAGFALFKGDSAEIFSALLGIGLAAVCYTIVKLFDKRLRRSKLFAPRLVRVDNEKNN